MIRNRAPEANNVGIDNYSLGVNDAIVPFNDESFASLEILNDMNMEPGDHMMKCLQIQNESCKIHATYTATLTRYMSAHQLKTRKIIRIVERKDWKKILIR